MARLSAFSVFLYFLYSRPFSLLSMPGWPGCCADGENSGFVIEIELVQHDVGMLIIFAIYKKDDEIV